MPLYVNVIPGATVTDTTEMDASVFNQLGTPVVDISGTLDGSSAIQNGAGTVTNAMLENMPANTVKGRDESTGVPVNLTMHSSMDIDSGALKVKDGGITTTQLASTATVAAGAIADVNIASGIIGPNKLKAQAALTLLGNGGDTASTAPEPILIGSGLTVTNADELATATRSRTANVATITTGTAHGYAVGDKINVTGLGGTGYTAYGVTTLTGTTGSTIKYDSVNIDGSGTPIVEGSTSDINGKVRRIEAAGVPTTTITVLASPIKAFALFNTTVATGLTYSRAGTSVTVTYAGHSIESGDLVGLGSSASSVIWAMFTVTGVVAGVSFTVSDPSSLITGATIKKRSIIKSSYNITSVDQDGTGRAQFIFTNALSSTKYAVTTSSWNGSTIFCAPYTRATMLTSSLYLALYLASSGSATDMSEGQYFSMCVMQ